MYAGRVACCLLVSHVEYAPHTIKVRKKDDLVTLKNDGYTDGHWKLVTKVK